MSPMLAVSGARMSGRTLGSFFSNAVLRGQITMGRRGDVRSCSALSPMKAKRRAVSKVAVMTASALWGRALRRRSSATAAAFCASQTR